MLPWLFSYDRINYSRYLTHYCYDIQCLEKSNPSANQALEAGAFSVQRSFNPFSRVAVDQTIEQTINRDTKTKGGILGFSQSASAVHKWVMTAHERAAITRGCKTYAAVVRNDGQRKEVSKRRLLQDEVDVSNATNLLESWISPFAERHDFVNITSGVVATSELRLGMLNAHSVGEMELTSFIRDRKPLTFMLLSKRRSCLPLHGR